MSTNFLKLATAVLLAFTLVAAAAGRKDVTTVLLKTPLPPGTGLTPSRVNRTAYMTITYKGINSRANGNPSNAAYYDWMKKWEDAVVEQTRIVAYTPKQPETNGNTILNLVPTQGVGSSTLSNNFTFGQLNAGRVAAGLIPAVFKSNAKGNGTDIINRKDMLFVMTFADGTSSAGFARSKKS